MSVDLIVSTTLTAAVLAFGLVRLLELFARQRGVLDRANWRSMHVSPTPRLGGLGIIAAAWVALLLWRPGMGPGEFALLLCCTGIGAVGAVDDLRPLRPSIRLVAEVVIAAAFAVAVADPVTIALPGITIEIPAGVAILAITVWIVGVTNIWNFMDGLDGLAAGTAVIAAIGVVALSAPSIIPLVIAGAAVGFLAWNISPAMIFLGDAGSLFLGSMLAAAPFAAATGPDFVTLFLVLAPFLLDASLTLARRALRHEDLLAAHSDHLYQQLARSGVPHRAIANGYWATEAVAVLFAIQYTTAGTAGRLLILAGTLGLFMAYAVVVQRRPPIRGGAA